MRGEVGRGYGVKQKTGFINNTTNIKQIFYCPKILQNQKKVIIYPTHKCIIVSVLTEDKLL